MIELGPVNFKIEARNEMEQRIAHYHVRTARLLLGQLKAVAGNVGMQSRKVKMPDGTMIAVVRNMNPYTGQAVCAAIIRPQAARPLQPLAARIDGPFMWIGLKDRRAGAGNQYCTPFMSIWEPPADRPGGRVLVPSLGYLPAPQ